jgi:hypothetical protein
MYLTDPGRKDRRAARASVAHLWDNGANAIDELGNVMKVRAAALRRFGENNIPEGAPMATIEEVLVPIYMYHRYQVEAAAKIVGGQDYTFSVKGKGDRNPQIVAPEEQRRALAAVLETLKPGRAGCARVVTAFDSTASDRIWPHARRLSYSHTTGPSTRWRPQKHSQITSAGFLLNPERAARLVQFHALDQRNPGLAEVIDKIFAATWKASPAAGYAGEIQHTVNLVILHDLMTLAAGDRTSESGTCDCVVEVGTIKGLDRGAEQVPT